jgi:hypothetical protein
VKTIVGREDRPHQLLQHEADAEGGQQRFERPPVQKTDDRALQDHAGHARHEKRRRHGEQNGGADVVRHRELHDVGSVGAEHHQLAVRHVDDAHDTERDGQPDGDEHEHRSDAQSEEQRLDGSIHATQPVDRAHGARGGLPDLRVGVGEPAVRCRFELRGQTVSHLRSQGVGEHGDRVEPRVRVGAVERCQREPDFDLVPHAGVGLDLRSHAQLRNGLRVERLQHRLDGGEPHGRIGARQTETRHECPQTRSQAVVRADLREIAARRRPGARKRHRIDQLERGEVLISRLDDDDLLVRLADEQTILEQRRQDGAERRVVSRAEPLDDLLFLGEARRGQLAQRRAQIAGARLRESRRRREAGCEQKRRYL